MASSTNLTRSTAFLQEVDETGAPRGPILSANDHGTGEMTVRQAVERLKKAKRVVGHNIAGFDIPAIAKVFPDFKVQAYFDTLLMSTLVYPDLRTATSRPARSRERTRCCRAS